MVGAPRPPHERNAAVSHLCASGWACEDVPRARASGNDSPDSARAMALARCPLRASQACRFRCVLGCGPYSAASRGRKDAVSGQTLGPKQQRTWGAGLKRSASLPAKQYRWDWLHAALVWNGIGFMHFEVQSRMSPGISNMGDRCGKPRRGHRPPPVSKLREAGSGKALGSMELAMVL